MSNSYVIRDDDEGRSITCRLCGKTSWHPEDIAQRYCGHCHIFHDEVRVDPGYWMHETSGALRPAVEAYLTGSMTPEQIAAMRAYLRQWINAAVWDQNPHASADERAWLAWMRGRIEYLTSVGAIEQWVEEAVDQGMDPL